MKRLSTIISIFIAGSAAAQTTDSSKLSVSGYAEIFYNYDFNKPENHTIPGFLYNHNRSNEVNINLAFVKGAYNGDRVRANLALMAGTYAQANLAAEQPTMQHVFEANAGIKLSKSANLWFDAGVFASHLGFESAISRDCWTLTRSILAENSPYYESGAKLSYTTPNEKWFVSFMYLNGWQRIKRLDGNSTPAFGAQVTFKPSSKVTLNYSNFIGNVKPDSVKQMRYFNNFYGIFQLTDKFGLMAGLDYGIEQTSKGSSDYNTWYSPVLIARYAVTDQLAIAARGEYYSDENGVIIASGTENGFKTFGYSIGFDYTPFKNVLLRAEGKNFKSKDTIFTRNGESVSNNAFVTTSLTFSF
ncbi:porin [Solitalea koreensis]|uniref:Beta-barrel porin-2, OmpL-like. bbp2 n=1 Tax=Solitalea koreensis TaxID=543615 RepID=A0A521C4E5_9SPHI|nr:porin [Solitalea koreensis]SMO54269.1 Putative beta-barrel porin-2, OmpL-like. bbp2 [Solitalea koreensis]